ncbi:hypothetical protein [Polyangium mundeleinium]|uniref:Delta-60 repeat domain-containing protein n=1 Tax=Polyangium mundeleinium TaxID=2995306 RepID=A0ABT5EMB4_9BACT|nr:hypothetical protein [Polyangium mundeleinium]MDC0742969.1 hypothetical protein [Polyangium mundeleinium]
MTSVVCPEDGPVTGAEVFTRSFVVDTILRDIGLGVGVDAAGNTLVAGTFRNTVDLGGGPLVAAGGHDLFVAKLDPAGATVWSVRFGSQEDERFAALAVDEAGGIWLVGSHGLWGSGFDVIALDSTGKQRFSRTYGGGDYQVVNAAAVDREGSLLLVGHYEGRDLDLGLGRLGVYGEGFLAKIGRAGNTVFARPISGSSDNDLRDVAAAPDGDVVLAGSMRSVLSLDGIEGAGAGATDAFAARFDARGQPRWIRRFGGPEFDEGHAVAVDGLGNTWLTGGFEQIADLGAGPIAARNGFEHFVVVLDPAGRPLRHRLGLPRRIAADGAGNVVLAGEFDGTLEGFGDTLTSGGGTDAYLVKLGQTGEVRWSKRVGGAKSETVRDLAVNCRGRIALVGSRVDPTTLHEFEGPIEMFVMALAP